MPVEAPPAVVTPLEAAAPPPAAAASSRSMPWWAEGLIWILGIAIAWWIGKHLTAGFPANRTYDLAAKFNAFNDWVITHQRTSALFVDFLVPLRNGIQHTYDHLVLTLSRMTWLGVIATAAAIAGLVAGWRYALLTAAGFGVMGVLGLWEPSLETLALMVLAVLIAVVIGIPIGIWTGLKPGAERVIRPLLDAMQTIPAFSYLVPVVLLFGIGVPAALIATVIFALPPVIRLTSHGIRHVPETTMEVGHSFGSTRRQMLRRIQLPLGKGSVLLGVNQTIMMALGIVVIAASVGVGGLGQVVLDGLSNLNVGLAFAAGLAIVVMAIVFDRVTMGWGERDRKRRGKTSVRIFGREISRWVAVALALGLAVAAVLIGREVLRQETFPASWTVSIDDPINSALDWVTRTFGGITDWITSVTITYALNPLLSLLTEVPWWMVAGFTALVGWRVSRRWGLALLAFVCVAGVGVLGMWDDSMDTMSQVIVAVVGSVALAIPIGIWMSRSDRVQLILRPILDAMQTMPQFVYLIPVVALFGIGRVPGVIAGLVYALPPGIRLTNHGIREVPHETVEAADAYGATPRQTLWKIQVPLARPSIMLGVNQTVIMVFSVVIIAGLVGGGGLGLRVINGLSHDPGAGMVAGICILLLAIAIDRITQSMGEPATARTTRMRWWRSAAGPSTTAPVAVALGDDQQLAEEEEDR
jgi:glycine betaine/proline transport system permease protein